MKRLFFTCFLALALARIASGQVAAYTNSASLITSFPPNIDATNFINNALFDLEITASFIPFDFSDTLNFTNNSIMYCPIGFRFDNVTSSGRRMAANLFNGNGAQILTGLGVGETAFVDSGYSVLPQIVINATNVVNTGTIDADASGLISVTGNALNLARGTFNIEGFTTTGAGDLLAATNSVDVLALGTGTGTTLGVFDNFYGIGSQTNLLSFGSFTLPSPSSPPSLGDTVTRAVESIAVSPPNATPFVWLGQAGASNFAIQVVFINTNLPGISTQVRFAGSGFTTPTIQWSAVITNNAGVAVATNFLYLQDQFGSFQTNFLVTNGFSVSGAAQLAPYNYTFTRSLAGFSNLNAANFSPYSTALFGTAFPATNAYAAYEVNVQPTGFIPDPNGAATSITNLPGRIQLMATNAGSWMDLSRSTITGANYLSLSATNEFMPITGGATIAAPNMDLNLGTTNGTLAINGLVVPSLPRFDGVIDMYSARWTNVVTNIVIGVSTNVATNTYHVLIVDSGLSATSPVEIQNLTLRSRTNSAINGGDNLVINDLLNVVSNMSINATSLTLATNPPTAAIPAGELNLLGSSIIWQTEVTNLQNLTNWGSIATGNNLDFLEENGGPYLTWVNHGSVFGGEITVNADFLENGGSSPSVVQVDGVVFTNESSATIESLGGNITLQASNALLVGGFINATPEGGGSQNINISAGSLVISNQILSLTGALNLSLTNSVVDGGAASGNQWTAANGINLNLRPKTGDFLGTTITLTAGPNEQINNTWDGQDRGVSPAGFANNAAVGHLILDAADTNGTFLFQGLDSVNPYALYVDQIELQGGATGEETENGNEVFTAFDIPANMTIYFADAISSGHDISEKLNGAFGLPQSDGSAGGQLKWVSSYAGIFSSTNVAFPNGLTYQINGGLFAAGFPVDVNLSVVRSSKPPSLSVLSWYAPANSTNHLYVNTNLTGANWVSVTNFVQGSGASEVTVTNFGQTNSASFYKVVINPAKP